MLPFQIDEKKVRNKWEQHIHNRIFNETSMESFRLRLREIKLDNLKTSDDLNLAYNEFQRLFS